MQVNAIEAAVAAGMQKFILDLRGNGGGDNRVGVRLYNAMGLTSVQGGGSVTRRISDIFINSTGWWYWHLNIPRIFGADYIFAGRDAPGVGNPNNVFVSVLTDNETYSSAMHIASWVQGGGFGNIIGEPSRNAPNSFGDMRFISLPHSGLIFPISTTYFTDGDVNVSVGRDVLWPDIPVNAADAFDVAMEYLRSLP